MSSPPSDSLAKRHCRPCEGGVAKLTAAQLPPLLAQTPRWQVDQSGNMIFRTWKLQDFAAAMVLLNRIADIAEEQQHHPDLHLSGYRHVRVELTTHAIGGLSENDFILAAKIDQAAGA